MEWQKFYSSFGGHRKTIGVSLAAKGLWLECFAWVGQQETGGFIPEAVVIRTLAGTKRGTTLTQQLTNAGLWEAVEGGYQMHDYDDRQADADRRRELNRLRQQRHRQRHVTRDKPNSNDARAEQSRRETSPTGDSEVEVDGIEVHVGGEGRVRDEDARATDSNGGAALADPRGGGGDLRPAAARAGVDRGLPGTGGDADRRDGRPQSPQREASGQGPGSGSRDDEARVLDPASAGVHPAGPELAASGTAGAAPPAATAGHSRRPDEPDPDVDMRRRAERQRGDVVKRIFDLWRLERGHLDARLLPKRDRVIRARLSEGFTEEDLEAVIRGAALDPWDDRGRHDDLTVLMRDGTQVEKFRGYWRGHKAKPNVDRFTAAAQARQSTARAEADDFIQTHDLTDGVSTADLEPLSDDARLMVIETLRRRADAAQSAAHGGG